MVDLPDGQPERITDGLAEEAGYFSPAWSPDGSYLTMLATKDENITLWVREASSGILRRLSERTSSLYDSRYLPYAWLSNEEILYAALPEGELPVQLDTELRTPRKATAAWPKAWYGQEVTASVLKSGVPVDLKERPQGELMRIDVLSDDATTLASGLAQEFTPSPDGRWVAYLELASIYQPEAHVPLPFGSWESATFTVKIVSSDATSTSDPLEGLELSRDVLSGSLRWSVDGRALAFIGYGESRADPPRIYSLSLEEGTVRTHGSPTLNPTPAVRLAPHLLWSAQGDLLVYAAKLVEGGQPGPRTRRDWWVLSPEGNEQNLTQALDDVPAELFAEEGHSSFVGLAGGNLWRIEPDGATENLTETLEPALSAILWPNTDEGSGDTQLTPTAGASFSRIIVEAKGQEGDDAMMMDLSGVVVEKLTKPSPDARLAGYDPARGTVLFSQSGDSGTYLWTVDTAQRVHTVVETNTFLRDIAPGLVQSFEYRSLDGETLRGGLLLPPDHQQGEHHPLVVWVYPGASVGSVPFRYDRVSMLSSLNVQVLAASGYAVLKPSMPLEPEGEVDDPMVRLMHGVLPAVDHAVDHGVADPDNIFLMGQSYGGYGTYGLVTQTKRFKAAVSLAGSSNLISLYGQFDARHRYDSAPHEESFMQALIESAQLRMGSPPWQDVGRYLRNSPVFAVDRVQTPVMIIQGDMDYVAIQQGEEFFWGLYRQGKRAEFVRYWGEGHVLESPANIKDMWQRVLGWFETFTVQEVEDKA